MKECPDERNQDTKKRLTQQELELSGPAWSSSPTVVSQPSASSSGYARYPASPEQTQLLQERWPNPTASTCASTSCPCLATTAAMRFHSEQGRTSSRPAAQLWAAARVPAAQWRYRVWVILVSFWRGNQGSSRRPRRLR